MKILFLEDNYDAAKMSRVLEKEGYTVYRAKNPLDAMDLLDSGENFDLAIIDLAMSRTYLPEEMDGIDDSPYTGWLFYKHMIKNKPPLNKNIIVLSALIDEFKKITPYNELEGIIMLDKRESDIITQLLEAVKQFS